MPKTTNHLVLRLAVVWLLSAARLIYAPALQADDAPAPATGSAVTTVLPGHSSHGEVFNEGPRQAAYLMGGTGKVSIAVTTQAPTAQEFFNQGVGQLHGFWYYEAERSFRQVAALDPDCAMAYWGMAMANFNNENRAKPFLAKAVERKDKASPRERDWIDALNGYFNGDTKEDGERRRNLLKRWEDIYNRYPDELEAKAFVLWQLWDNNDRGAPIGSRLATQALISEVLAAEPLHPAHHYRIHLGDLQGANKDKTFLSAGLCGPSAPSIAHMWHMPGHTYSDSQRYADGAWQQDAALRVDHAHMIRARMIPDETYLFVHNRGWLIENLDFTGRVREAIDLCKHVIELPRHPKFGQATAADARRRLLELLANWELWDELLALENNAAYFEPTEDRDEQLLRAKYFGRAHWIQGHADQGQKNLAQLDDWLQKTRQEQQEVGDKAEAKARDEKKPDDQIAKAKEDARGGFNGRITKIEELQNELAGFQKLAAGDAPGALASFAKAKDLSPLVLSRTQFLAGDPGKADELSRDTQHKLSRMAGRVDLLYRGGKTEEARKLFDEMRPLAGQAQLDLPPFDRLRAAVESWQLPADWRLPRIPPGDLGQRPPLDELGPIHWRPSPAADWTLTDLDGKQVGLGEYRGKPLVVIFYLGFGCIHCVEQLNAFSPLAEKYQQAGISLVAVSTDSLAAMQASAALGAPGLKQSLRILSDESLGAFKAYRTFDDFEQRPLHGAFLIDAAGLVRWQDISYTPFTNPEFLLTEAQRLLAQPAERVAPASPQP
jgi:peroxiredoxin